MSHCRLFSRCFYATVQATGRGLTAQPAATSVIGRAQLRRHADQADFEQNQ
jgi:hypothetical protein